MNISRGLTLTSVALVAVFLSGCAEKQPARLQQPSGPPIQAHDTGMSELPAIDSESSSTPLPDVRILTPTQGVDFNAYVKQFRSEVEQNWHNVMPEAALRGKKGKVIVRAAIRKDGKIAAGDVTLESSSSDSALDDVAVRAIRGTSPFKPLPSEFHGEYITIRFSFNYNLNCKTASCPNGSP